MSPDTDLDLDGDGKSDVDAESTLANLETAITSWAAGTNELTLFLVDHGYEDNGEGRFRLNSGSENVLTAPVLDGWLDQIQSATDMTQNVIVDCCNSGAFVPYLAAPSGAMRHVLAACADNELTYFVADGLISFSEAFWNSIRADMSIGHAFVTAKDSMSRYQTAWLDGDGDGTFAGSQEYAANAPVMNHRLGLPAVTGADRPQIGRVTSNQAIGSSTDQVVLWASDLSGPISINRVWAVVVPPDFRVDPQSGEPVTDDSDLSRVQLSYEPANRRWEASYGDFDKNGSYKVSFYAEDDGGAISLPKNVFIHKQTIGQKVILVAGNTPYRTDGPPNGNFRAANSIYQTLIARGIGHGEIHYLSAESGNLLIDQNVTRANLQNTIANWVGDVEQLALIVIAGSTEEHVLLSDGDSLPITELDAWLDDYQNAFPTTVLTFLDTPDSGTYMDDLLPPAGKSRANICSSKPLKPSYMFSHGSISFSQFFFGGIFLGLDVESAFNIARLAVRAATSYTQDPTLDDNADGESSSSDGALASEMHIGAAFLTGGDDLPVIGAHTTDVSFAPGGVLRLWASDVFDSDGVVAVVATVVPQAPLDPNDEFDVPLAYDSNTREWSATHQFDTPGTRTLLFQAEDGEGNFSDVEQSIARVGNDSVRPDVFEDDDATTSASDYLLSDIPDFPTAQDHNFHEPGDEDWIHLFVPSTTDNPSGGAYTMHIQDPGPSSDVVVELHDLTVSPTLLALVDDGGVGEGETLPYIFTHSGDFYWLIRPSNPAGHGAGSEYTALLTNDTGDTNGIISSIGTDELKCVWDDGVIEDFAGYNLNRYNGDTGSWITVNKAPLQDNEFTDTGLQPGTRYVYRVTAEKVGGGLKNWTPLFKGTTLEDKDAPTVSSVTRFHASPTSRATVDFAVIFSESVSGVDTSDFEVVASGLTGTSVDYVAGENETRIVTVSTGMGYGTLQLRLLDDDSIIDAVGHPLDDVGSQPILFSATYVVERTAEDSEWMIVW